MNKEVFINSIGVFLPGEPVTNDEMEDYLGEIYGTPSRVRSRILKQNKILTRHYAIDKQQKSLFSNAGMAARAVQQAIERCGIGSRTVEFLAAATSQADLPLPGFASMVHGELGIPVGEVASLHGVCASGLVAIQNAYLQVHSGNKKISIACASEFASRLFKASRFECQQRIRESAKVPFDTEFLRWMLSDGAGAMVMQDSPNERGLSLRVEWIRMHSLAHLFPPCMYVGAQSESSSPMSWLDYPSYQDAADAGAINLRQDTRMLSDVVQHSIDGLFSLIEEGAIKGESIDWFVAHYSSHVFREQALELLQRGGLVIPEDRIFSNLYTKGNVGSASLYIALEELFLSGNLQVGDSILCLVPESGRFVFGYMLLTVTGEDSTRRPPAARLQPPSEVPRLNIGDSELEQRLVRQLTRVWVDFDARLSQVPIIKRLYGATFSLADYKELLFNLRQQVIDGSRWISRAASNITEEYFPIRSAFIAHSSDEHRDYEMLEKNYVSIGGSLEDLQDGEKNIGSMALSSFILERASRENPFDLIGSMFIIEGLGQRLAHRWGKLIREQLRLSNDQVSFFLYHGVSDEKHFERLDLAIEFGILTEDRVKDIVKTAKVTARLYVLQLEELGTY